MDIVDMDEDKVGCKLFDFNNNNKEQANNSIDSLRIW